MYNYFFFSLRKGKPLLREREICFSSLPVDLYFMKVLGQCAAFGCREPWRGKHYESAMT